MVYVTHPDMAAAGSGLPLSAIYTIKRVPIKVAPKRAAIALLGAQLVLLILFGFFTEYHDGANPKKVLRNALDEIAERYPMFQDVHVMIFIGFGFLMTFLRKYGFSAVGFTLLLGALMVQWAALCQGFFRLDPSDGKVHLSITSLLNADIATAAVLISMGAVLGKTTPLQLVVMGVVEMVCFAANEHLGGHVFKAVDLGGSMFVHAFGAYFGLAVSRVLGKPSSTDAEHPNEGSNYTSDIFAMIGTVFLWLFWPSFNGALADGHARHRAVINTYLSLASCCVVAFAVSSITQRDSKFNMVHIQNATLAGGVAVGTSADLMVQPVGALVIGCLAGLVSVLGYAYLQPVLLKHFKLHDTCGVHNLHGMPGVMAGIVGAVMAAIATTDTYGNSLYTQFPARAPTNFTEANAELTSMQKGDGRTALLQAGYQVLALVVTLAISIVSGTVTGFVMRAGDGSARLGPNRHTDDQGNIVDTFYFNDMPFWLISGIPSLPLEPATLASFRTEQERVIKSRHKTEENIQTVQRR